jgi:hypothetical protein
LPTILVGVHFLIMLWVGYVWRNSEREKGMVAGPDANFVWNMVQTVDYPAYWISERTIIEILKMPSPGPVDTFCRLIRFEKITDVGLHLFWPFLVVLGSAQWFAIGLFCEPIYRLGRRFVSVNRHPA